MKAQANASQPQQATQRYISQLPRLLLLLSILLSLSLTVALPPALAQSPCGDTETVVARDTLYRIANRCNTSRSLVGCEPPNSQPQPDLRRTGANHPQRRR
ncbi:MAG: hypothetical protein R3E79_15160 [Caldilineaceae bacterium]